MLQNYLTFLLQYLGQLGNRINQSSDEFSTSVSFFPFFFFFFMIALYRLHNLGLLGGCPEPD